MALMPPMTDAEVRTFVEDYITEPCDPQDTPFSANKVINRFSGHNLNKKQVSQILDQLCQETDPHLSREDNGNFITYRRVIRETEATADMELYDWQKEAIAAWESSHFKGIVEAVTGTGKTRMALAAWIRLRDHLKQEDKPLNCLIVVPTIQLMKQWYDQIDVLLPDQKVARLGGGYRETFNRTPICVGVVDSIVPRLHRNGNRPGLLDHAINGPIKSLLIADECHRYIDGQRNSQIRRFNFDFTLGLSATIEPFEVPGLGGICYELSFRDAYKQGLVPAFELVHIPVSFTGKERLEYEKLGDKITKIINQIKMEYPALADLNRRYFHKAVMNLVNGHGSSDPILLQYRLLLFKRAAIAHTAQNKLDLAHEICSMLLKEGRKKTIVFYERIRSADDEYGLLYTQKSEEMASALREGLAGWVGIIHSNHNRDERETTLATFRHNDVSALLACRSLDEGLDVPEIDAALLVASTQSERQRIQRIGRVLRKGDGGKRPIVITLYVPEAGDGNVIVNDEELFGEAATIHHLSEDRALEGIRNML